MALSNIGDLEKAKFRGVNGKSFVRMISNEHDYTHDGKLFYLKSFLDFTGGADETQYFMFTTPNTDIDIHAKASIAASVEFEVYLMESCTLSDNGSLVTTYNANRKSTETPGVLAYAAPTVSAEGTHIWVAKLGEGKRSSGISPQTNYELVAKNNTNYVFKMVKKSASAAYVDFDFHWYETEEI